MSMRPKSKSPEIEIHCSHNGVVPLADLNPHPKNPNKHNERQVALLAKVIKHQGWRAPIVVSSRSGFIVAGHARLEAAKLLGLKDGPVNMQAFKNEKDELAHLVADNKIAELAEIDPDVLKQIFADIPKFDLDLLGYDKTELEQLFATFGQSPPIGEGVDAGGEWAGMPEFNQQDKRAFRSIILHFGNSQAVEDFAIAIKADITKQTRYIWYPKIEIETYADKRYKSSK